MRKTNYRYLQIFLLSAVGLLVCAFGLFLYNREIRNDISENNCQTMNEVAEHQRYNLRSRIEADLAAVRNLAMMVDYLPEENGVARKTMNELLENTNYEYLVLVGTDGKGLGSSGRMVDISKTAYFETALQGGAMLHAPTQSLVIDKQVIPVTTPILVNGETTGLLVGAYTVDNLVKLLLPSYQGRAHTYLTNQSGDIILREKSSIGLFSDDLEKNLLEALKEVRFGDKDNREQIKQSMQEGIGGHSRFNLLGQEEIAHYLPLGINDWYIFVIVPEFVIGGQTQEIMNKTIVLTISILTVVLLAGLYLARLRRHSEDERTIHTQQLEQLAYFDALTGLPNLLNFKREAAKLLTENPNKHFVIFKFDIQTFKAINEMRGYEVGDCVIRAVANEMREGEHLGYWKDVLFARNHADEFLIFDAFDGNRERIEARLRHFTEGYNEKARELLGDHRVEFRYGRYFLERGELNIAEVLEKVNLAHRMAKTLKNCTVFDYDDSLKRNILREVEIANKMESALQTGQFKVYLQAKFRLSNESLAGAEALVRWDCPEEGRIISPLEFIPSFERNGFIVKLDFYMYEESCRLLRTWLEEGRTPIPISVNFSRVHLLNPQLVEQLSEIAERHQIPKRLIEIELTESIIYENEETLQDLLEKLHAAGFLLSMDDFGTGYSSLGLLKNLHVDTIKIDRSFFLGNKYEARAKTVIESVMLMAKKLGIETVAEGVEHLEHIRFLREVGCDVVQGYYYAKPIPAADFFRSH